MISVGSLIQSVTSPVFTPFSDLAKAFEELGEEFAKFSEEDKALYRELKSFYCVSRRGWFRMLWCHITGAA